MEHVDPRPGASMAELTRDAVSGADTLAKSEIELLRRDLREARDEAAAAALAFGGAALMGFVGLELVLHAAMHSVLRGPGRAFAAGVSLLAAAGAAGYAGYRALPREAMARAGDRVAQDVSAVTEEVR